MGLSALQQQIANYIYARAPAFGVNPNTALGIAWGEGLNSPTAHLFGNWDVNNYSYGPFQLHIGGLGSDFMNATGLQLGSGAGFSNWRQQVDFSLKTMATQGFGKWMSVGDAGGVGAITSKGAQFAAANGITGNGNFGTGAGDQFGAGWNQQQLDAGQDAAQDAADEGKSTQQQMDAAQDAAQDVGDGGNSVSFAPNGAGNPGALTQDQQKQLNQTLANQGAQLDGILHGMWDMMGVTAVTTGAQTEGKATIESGKTQAEAAKAAADTLAKQQKASTAAETGTAVSQTNAWLDSLYNMFSRGAIIVVGLIFLAVALWLTGQGSLKAMKVPKLA